MNTHASIPDWLHQVMTTWGEVTIYREDGAGAYPKPSQTPNGRGTVGSKLPNVALEFSQAERVLGHPLTPLAVRQLLEDRYYYAARGYVRPTHESVQAYFGSRNLGDDTAKLMAGFWEGALDKWVRKDLGKIRGEAGAGSPKKLSEVATSQAS